MKKEELVQDVFHDSLLESQKLVLEFIKNKRKFNKYTSKIILNNFECIKTSITRDIRTLKYVNVEMINDELKEVIINEAIRQNLVLEEDSLEFLKECYQVARNSIKLKVKSANYVYWTRLTDNEKEDLVGELINNNYKLVKTSPQFLKTNSKVLIANIKRNKRYIKYVTEEMKKNPEIFKHLILSNFSFSEEELKSMKLNCFDDVEVLKQTLIKLNIQGSNNQMFLERYAKLYFDAINRDLKIKDFEEIFRYVALEKWKEYRYDNFDFYDNVFGKICAELRCNKSFDKIDEEDIIIEIKRVLGDKYCELELAMKEYHRIYQNETEHVLEKIQPSKDVIAKMAALYVSKSKDEFIKEELDGYSRYINCFFEINRMNYVIRKKVDETRKKDIFRQLYKDEDLETIQFIKEIISKYSNRYEEHFIQRLIDGFIFYNETKLTDIIDKPCNYDIFIKYQKVRKLIKRLNNGYIKYDGPEVANYRDVIKYDEINKKYEYIGMCFDELEVLEFNSYSEKIRFFDLLKEIIMMRVNLIEVNTKIDNEILNELYSKISFNDKFFKYVRNNTINYFQLQDILELLLNTSGEINYDVFCDDKCYQYIYDLMVNKGMFWLLIFLDFYNEIDWHDMGINVENINKLINSMDKIINFANEFKFNLDKFSELFEVYGMSKISSIQDVAILGREIVEKLYKNDEYTNKEPEEIIMIAKELYCQMVKRSKSTVPYVSGKYLNYRYSLYDSHDVEILTAGIDTDACFRVNGNDNDFLHYCALDKNGFVIKITDEFGNFVARAAGFRNGNCVFINQLRTIFDEGGTGYLGISEHEIDEIIDTFVRACCDIVVTSYNNSYEKTKIEFVFVTKSYSLEMCDEFVVNDDVTTLIGDIPMENESEDWESFINNTNNLEKTSLLNMFETDYGGYPIVCVASSIREKVDEIVPDDIKRSDVLALYTRKRNKIVVANSCDETIFERVNRISAINCYLNDKDFEMVMIPKDSKVIIGDNWYVIYKNYRIVESCLVDDDMEARKEYLIVIDILNNSCNLCEEEMFNNIEKITSTSKKRILRKKS